MVYYHGSGQRKEGMRMKVQAAKLLSRFGVLLLILMMMSGCQQSGNSQETHQISAQTVKSEALLEELEPVTTAVAINNEKDKEIFAAAKVKHMHRLRLEQVRKDAHKRLSEEWPEWTVHFSTDKKVLLELQKLNKDMANETMKDKELKKRLSKIEEYMKG